MFFRFNRENIAMMLIKNGAGANANAVDSHGMNALHIAAMEDLPKIVEKLLEDPKISIDLQDKKFNTALHYASAEDSYESCKILLLRNASPDIVNDEGETPLHIAARENCIDILNSLIDCKKRKKMESGGMYKFIMDCQEVRHWSILMPCQKVRHWNVLIQCQQVRHWNVLIQRENIFIKENFAIYRKFFLCPSQLSPLSF